MIVTGHHDHRLVALREMPEARQRLASAIHEHDQVREQALLLVGLRDRDLVEVHPVGLPSVLDAPKNRSSERIGVKPSRSWPAHAGLPWRV